MKEVWLTRNKALLRRAATQDFDRIVFSDEKIFTVEQHLNPQNDRIWSTNMSASISYARKVGFPTETEISDSKIPK
jgi:hypothetical protein